MLDSLRAAKEGVKRIYDALAAKQLDGIVLDPFEGGPGFGLSFRCDGKLAPVTLSICKPFDSPGTFAETLLKDAATGELVYREDLDYGDVRRFETIEEIVEELARLHGAFFPSKQPVAATKPPEPEVAVAKRKTPPPPTTGEDDAKAPPEKKQKTAENGKAAVKHDDGDEKELPALCLHGKPATRKGGIGAVCSAEDCENFICRLPHAVECKTLVTCDCKREFCAAHAMLESKKERCECGSKECGRCEMFECGLCETRGCGSCVTDVSKRQKKFTYLCHPCRKAKKLRNDSDSDSD